MPFTAIDNGRVLSYESGNADYNAQRYVTTSAKSGGVARHYRFSFDSFSQQSSNKPSRPQPIRAKALMAAWFGGVELSAGGRPWYQFKCSSSQTLTTLPEPMLKLKYRSAGTIQKVGQNECYRFDPLLK
jgi:hypothetical protein